MPDLAPEAKARQQIDALLTGAGWTPQNYDRFDASAARYIALREIPVKGGRCDSLLLIDRVPIGVVEAKKAGTTLSMVAVSYEELARRDKLNLDIFWLKGLVAVIYRPR